MAKASIKPGQSVQTDDTPENLPATQAGSAPVPYSGDTKNYDDPSRDRKIPRIGIVNGVGPLFKKFPKNVGQIAFEERLILGDSVEVIALKLQKFYVEIRRNGTDLKYGDAATKKITEESGPIRTFLTANQAHQAGYAIDFDSNYLNKVEEAGTALFLVSGPADDLQDAFCISFGGRHWAPAVTTFRRGGFRSAFRLLKTIEDRATAKGDKLHRSVFKFFPEMIEGKQNSWFEPRVEVVAKLTDEDLAALEKAASQYIGASVGNETE